MNSNAREGRVIAVRVYTICMTQENPLDHAPPPNVSKKELIRLMMEFLRINPSMTPQEVYSLTKEYRSTSNLLKDTKIYEEESILRNLRLEEYGIDPNKCVLFEIVQPKGIATFSKQEIPLSDDDIRFWKSKLPDGLELFTLQGEITSLQPDELLKTKGKYYNKNTWWELYILEPAPNQPLH